MSEILVEINDLKKHFSVVDNITKREKGVVKAIDGISFSIKKGEAFGLVGESGSGKTTVGRAILNMIKKTEGNVFFDGQDVHKFNKKETKEFRTKAQYIFQDPYSSLNPRLRIGDSIAEPLLEHGLADKKNVRGKVIEILNSCGLDEIHYDRYPNEFSGGQKQRVVIARALALNPKFIIADEPVSALDVCIQAQIINLFSDLQKEKNLSYLFISHDLSVVEHLCTKIAIMYLGVILEIGDRDSLFNHPKHPYTRALLSAVPIPDPDARRDRIILQGDMPNPMEPPIGCRFNTRCPFATSLCRNSRPKLREVSDTQSVACHYEL